jgi:histidinol phosphatase-like enzyme
MLAAIGPMRAVIDREDQERPLAMYCQSAFVRCVITDGSAMPLEMASDPLVRMMQEANLPLSALYVCYTHPRATVSKFMEIESDICRKPNPAMLIEAMRDFGIPANETLYVGDRPIDEATAKNAGVDFSWANAFFHGQT